MAGCDSGSIGSFLTGILGNVAKDPTSAISGAKACSECVSGLTGGGTTTDGGTTSTDAGMTSTDSGTSVDGGSTTVVDGGGVLDGGPRPLKPVKASATKTQIVAQGKAVKTPKATASSSNACSQCEKLMKSTGVTKAATCLLGKATNGALGSKSGGAAQNSKGGSPADDMSDDCDGDDCSSAADGDTCTEGDDTCDMDPDDSTDDDGSFDLGDSDDSGNDSSSVSDDDFG